MKHKWIFIPHFLLFVVGLYLFIEGYFVHWVTSGFVVIVYGFHIHHWMIGIFLMGVAVILSIGTFVVGSRENLFKDTVRT